MGFLPWEIRVALPRESQLRRSRATQPTVHTGCFSVSMIHRSLMMDDRIFNVRTDVNECDCTRGCTDTRKRACTESWLWEKNSLPHRGIEPASAAWRSDALTNWATSPPSRRCCCCCFWHGRFLFSFVTLCSFDNEIFHHNPQLCIHSLVYTYNHSCFGFRESLIWLLFSVWIENLQL